VERHQAEVQIQQAEMVAQVEATQEEMGAHHRTAAQAETGKVTEMEIVGIVLAVAAVAVNMFSLVVPELEATEVMVKSRLLISDPR
jgi:hypothetical protein